MPDHPDLADGEADEDTDREQRDQAVHISARADEQCGGGQRQGQYTVSVDLVVRAESEDMRQVVVPRQ